jgi:3-polyprenyl-4-hydroxybenzoate decarboxylase
VIYGIRLLEVLRGLDGVETHLVLTSAARRTVTHLYDDLRRRNARRADLARAREMRTRIERALEAARQRTIRDRR